MEVNAAGQSDLIRVVGGTATINAGTVDIRAENGNYGFQTDYTILTADGGLIVNTPFDNITTNLAFLDPALTYNPFDVRLTLTRNDADFASAALTPNQLAAANALDASLPNAAGDMAAVIQTLYGLSAPQARLAYDQMSGASHAAFIDTEFRNSMEYIRTIMRRTQNHRLGFLPADSQGTAISWGRSPFLAMSEGRTINDTHSLTLAPSNMENTSENSRGLWGSGIGTHGDRNGTDVSSRYNYEIYGTALGLDVSVSEEILIGISGGYSKVDLDFNDLTDSGNIESYHGALYGSWTQNPWYLDGLLSYGRNHNKTYRNIVSGGINRNARADYRGDEFSFYTEGGRMFKLNRFGIQPLASFQAIYLAQEGFTEEGADSLNLDVDRSETKSFIGGLGFRAMMEYRVRDETRILPEVRARWAHEFNNESRIVDASFTGSPGVSFTVRGDNPERDRVILGAGVTVLTKANLALSVQYNADIAKDEKAHALLAGAEYSW